eukprot:1824870-Pyramimonas_sp.AAC.1
MDGGKRDTLPSSMPRYTCGAVDVNQERLKASIDLYTNYKQSMARMYIAEVEGAYLWGGR